jgi:hypothetical protein
MLAVNGPNDLFLVPPHHHLIRFTLAALWTNSAAMNVVHEIRPSAGSRNATECPNSQAARRVRQPGCKVGSESSRRTQDDTSQRMLTLWLCPLTGKSKPGGGGATKQLFKDFRDSQASWGEKGLGRNSEAPKCISKATYGASCGPLMRRLQY